MSSAVDNVLAAIEQVTGRKPKACGDGWQSCCPAHDDNHPSLSIAAGDDGRVLVRCHAGCPAEKVVKALGLEMSDLMPDDPSDAHGRAARAVRSARAYETAEAVVETLEGQLGPRSRTWTYTNSQGKPVGVVVRWDRDGGKEIRPVARNGKGWGIGAMPVPRPLYALSELADADLVFVTEGEKAADALRELGLVATTCAGGSQAAGKTDWSPLRGKEVVLSPDNDSSGERYADDVFRLLNELEPRPVIKEITLPGLPEKGDAVEFIAARREAGLDNEAIRAELLKLVDEVEAEVVGPISWEPPVPLGHFDLPEFPLEEFPSKLEWLRDYCAAVAESYQVPPDLPGMLVLAVGAAALAKRVEIVVVGDWHEPVNLFVAVAMEPGERKSAVFGAITRPLSEFEREEAERLAPDIARNESERVILANRLKDAETKAAKASKPEEQEEAKKKAFELKEELRNLEVLRAPRYCADDATPEAVSRLLHEQAGRIALLSPEGDTFDLMAGRYGTSGQPNLGVYLKGHAGDDIRVDRVSKDRPPEYVQHPALTVGLAVQPEVLRGLMEKKGFRGRGVLGRFLYSMPRSRVGHRSLRAMPVPPSVARRYADGIRTALRLQPATDNSGRPCAHIIRLSADAIEELDDFRQRVENELREGQAMSAIRDWGTKLPGAVCRIAGIFHGLIHASTGSPSSFEIDAETMRSAIAIGEYAVEHARAAYFEMGTDPAISLARRILDWLVKEGVTEFTKRDAFLRLRGTVRQAKETDAPLAILEEHLYIRERPRESAGPGRKPSPTYEVNPVAHAHNTQNAHNPVSVGDSAHCAHSAQGDC